MRTINDLDADEQKALTDYLRDMDIDVNTADEYEIFDEKEAQSMLEDMVEYELAEASKHYPLFIKSLDEVMDMYSLDDLFTEIGVGMFIYN
jgi:glutathionylspermidine synthase